MLRLLEGQLISIDLAKHARENLKVDYHAIQLRATVMEHRLVARLLPKASIMSMLVFVHLLRSFRARDLRAFVVDLKSMRCANQFAVVVV